MNVWMDFMLVFETDKHFATPRENNKSIIFSWLDEKLASSWRKSSYTAQQGIVFVLSLANTEYYTLTQSAIFALQISLL